MQVAAFLGRLRLTRSEVAFFLVVFVVSPVVSDLEYTLNREPGSQLSSSQELIRTVYGILQALPFVLYYKLILPYLFRRRPLRFIALLVLFLALLDSYTKYAVYGGLANAWFLPKAITGPARVYYQAGVWLHFSLVYVARELFVVSVLGYHFQLMQQQRQIDQLQQAQIQAELSGLKAQIQPHFFFNTLNSIYALALQGSAKTAPLVAKHAQMMRYILHQAARPTVSLAQEVAFLQNYVAVEAVRYSDKIAIQFDVQYGSQPLSIEPLLLLPFIENPFKHGVADEMDTGFVSITLVVIDQELILEVANSIAPPVAPQPAVTGTGLVNVRKRLALLYPQQHALTIQAEATRYTLQLRLQLRHHD